MDFSKLKNKLLILLCVFIVLFPFWCIRGLCADAEEVTFSTVSNLIILNNTNAFTTNTSNSVGYFQLEKGYKYTITNNSSNFRALAISSDIPVLNGTYTYLYTLPSEDSYNYVATNNDYLYFDFSNSTNVVITREKLDSMNSAVGDLVSNVGTNQIWQVFESAIPYISAVAIFVFGFVIITYLYLKLSNGKGGF